MLFSSLFDALAHSMLGLALSARLALAASAAGPIIAPAGTYHTSWIGNSFGGADVKTPTANGFGQWVQDGVGSMAVSADGTVFLGVLWDEAGRDLGLYKNGQPNRVLVQAPNSPRWAWGFYVANNAVCVDGANFYVGNLGKALLRFQWNPGDINSSKALNAAIMPEIPIGMSCSAGKIALAYPDKIEIRNEADLQPVAGFPATDMQAILLAPDNSFWVIEGGHVKHLNSAGGNTGIVLAGVGKPMSLAWTPKGNLIVTDNGPAQQVLFFDVTGKPKLVSKFGVQGGVYSGVAGAVEPQKLFGLRNAGMDAQGSLYVAMGFDKQPTGNSFLRAFSPAGKLLWENYAAAFVDTYGFQPGTDGSIVYGRTTRWQLDLSRTTPGSEAVLRAITLDPLRYPNDHRGTGEYSVYPRLLQGKMVVYMIGQHFRPLTIFAGTPGSEILHPAGQTPLGGWAWDIRDNGDLWLGDAPGNQIELFRLGSVNANGEPVYDWNHPETWPWPAEFRNVRRVIYNPVTDSLYIFGYLIGQPDDSWGVVGFTGRRYDGWIAGHPKLIWTNMSLPQMPDGMGFDKPLSACSVSLAGDYLFFGAVKTPGNRPRVDILSSATGKFAGTLVAGPEVGEVGGEEDIVGSVAAMERKNGEYLILVEDDWHAKNLLFRWQP